MPTKRRPRIFKYLDDIAQMIQVPLYWFDENNVVLGGNDLIVEAVGGKSIAYFIGKTPYDYYPHDMADKLVKANNEIMQTGKTIIQEEAIRDVSTGKVKYFSAYKSPLRDDRGKIIGTIGTSIDITAQKEAEILQAENELQKTQILEQEKFKKVAEQVAHDIRSPLASLLMVIKSYESKIPETVRITLREAAIGIEDIANNLLNKYMQDETQIGDGIEERQPVLISLLLSQILTAKKFQYKNLPIKFAQEFCPSCNFIFANLQPSGFKRMMSNLLNNAVEATEGNNRKITVKLDIIGKIIKIIVQDNGKGMAPKLVNKILNNVTVTTDKKGGYGIGLSQVSETLQRNNGNVSIDSKIGKGTKFILKFPLVESPSWLARNIDLYKDDTVVILDDDASIHGAWEARFVNYADIIKLQHFSSGEETINFINNFTDKNKIFLLADFELLKQNLNGLQVIEQTEVDRAILVTSHYANNEVHNLAMQHGVKILPKQLASDVEININVRNKDKSKTHKKIDVVIIDDNEMFADSVAALLQHQNKLVDKYYDPYEFLKNINEYSNETIICMDNDFRSNITGIELAKKLHQDNFTKLYLLSGTDFNNAKIPKYLKVILKTDIDAVKKII